MVRAMVYIENEIASMRAANAISRYFHQRHPEYYARILNCFDFPSFDTAASNYSLDLYLLEVQRCDETDAGYRIAIRLREAGSRCMIAFVVPTEGVALRITQSMFQPGYIFLKAVVEEELYGFLDDFFSRTAALSFMEFTFQYKKWLLNVEKITYILTNGSRSLLVCVDVTLESTERLADLERRLPGCFLRVDKGCLINTRQLVAADFAEHKAIFAGGAFVYMSRRGSKKLQELLRSGGDSKKELA